VEVLDGVASKLDSKDKKSTVSIEEAISDYCKCSAPGQCQNPELSLKQNKMVSSYLNLLDIFCCLFIRTFYSDPAANYNSVVRKQD
jgi:hypothetical protein